MPWLSFDGHREGRKARGLLAPALPAGFGVLKTKFGHELAGGINDDDVVLPLGPIETDEVNARGLGGGHDAFPVGGSGAFGCSVCRGSCPWSS